MEHFGEILKAFRTEVLKVSQDELSAIMKKESPSLRANGSTIGNYERKEREHGTAEFYRVFKALYGIDLPQCWMEKGIVIEDLTKLTPDEVQSLRKSLKAKLLKFPLFKNDIPPFNGQDKYPAPFCMLPSVFCEVAEFAIEAIDNSMVPVINKGDYVFCRSLLADDKTGQGDLYLVSFGNSSSRTFKIGSVEKKENEVMLVQAKPDARPVVIPENAVKGIYKVVGQYRGEAGINHDVESLYAH